MFQRGVIRNLKILLPPFHLAIQKIFFSLISLIFRQHKIKVMDPLLSPQRKIKCKKAWQATKLH